MTRERTLSLIRRQFANVTDVGRDVFRANWVHEGRIIGVYYFDFAQPLVRPEFNMSDYLQNTVATDYYRHEGSLQWNYYLYFVMEKNAYEAISDRIPLIEANRTFARKFVREETVLERELTKPLSSTVRSQVRPEDVAAIWTQKLTEASLGQICDSRIPYTRVVEQFLSGKGVGSRDVLMPAQSVDAAQLGRPVRSIEIKNFRPYPETKRFEFGTVNLIRGANGSGKTSLLEAIELCICGGIFRQEGNRPHAADILITFSGERAPEKCPEHDLSIYRDRDLAWYGGYYRTGNQLWRNFNRFNFLDSDAAFRLSSATSSEEIKQAINALFLGESANMLGERMRQCLERFRTEERALNKSLQKAQSDSAKLTADLDALANIRFTREGLLSELQRQVEASGWKRIPRHLDHDDLLTLQGDVDEFASSLRDYTGLLHWMPRVSVSALERENENLQSLHDRIAAKWDSACKTGEALAEANEEISKAESLLKILGRLSSYHREPEALSLLDLKPELEVSRAKLASLTEAAGSARYIDFTLLEGKNTTFGALYEQLTVELEKQRRLVALKEQRQAKLETQLGDVKAVVSQIKGLGQRFCELKHDADECPLCGAQYALGELLMRLSTAAVGSVTVPALQELTFELERERIRFEEIQSTIDSLTLLKEAASLIQQKPIDSLTLKLLVRSIKGLNARIGREQSRVARLTETRKRLKLKGYIETELKELLLQASSVHGVTIAELSDKASFAVLLADRQKRATLLWKKARELRKQQSTIQQQLDTRAQQLTGKTDWDDVITELERRLSLVSEVLATVNRQKKKLLFQADEEFVVLTNRLKTLVDTIARLQVALRKVEEKDTLETRLSSSLEEAKAQFTKLQPRHARAKQAIHALTNILEKENEAKYLSKAVKEQRERLVAIFSNIHAPREFGGVRFDGEILLDRRSQVGAKVSEISGGQRSALALSIFLSLNSSVSDRAPWLIFDDPVAQVDDLNTLSFFDTLRDLVLLGSRQVFFATANTRIANLFARKFDFLGSELKVYELNRSDH